MTTYKDAGIDLSSKEKLLEKIRESARESFTEDVLSAATTFKFGGTISLKKFMQYDHPVLVLSTDGVGTKMIVAEMAGDYSRVGEDLVNHSINDILTSGARPLFFLDYVASGKLDSSKVSEIVSCISETCKKNRIILAGGETAEMPGVYQEGRYELSGTIGGIVDKNNMIDGSGIKKGDVMIGLESSGLHTNGFSLARKIFFEDNNLTCRTKFPEMEKDLGQTLLEPHREYASSVLPLIEKKLVNGIVHITGGGFDGNIPRILPEGLCARIKKGSWEVPPIFRKIQEMGSVSYEEMMKTFNMGIGLVLVVSKEKAGLLASSVSEKVWEIGEIGEGKGVHYE